MVNIYEQLKTDALKLGIELGDNECALVRQYADFLIETNGKFNLTSITDEKDVLYKHFLDSFTLYPLLKETQAETLLDVGSGGGFPGLALSILFPDIKIDLLEATGKKTDFLKEAAKLLERKNVRVINGRSEEYAHIPAFREKYDIVTARALARMNTLLEYTMPYTKIGGIVIAMKKGQIEEEIKEASKACRLMGGNLENKVTVTLPGMEDDPRYLIIYRKKSQTPGKYPRRNGMPKNSPII